MSDTHHDFDLAAESPGKNNGPKTEELDSGDYFNAPERHWLVRFQCCHFWHWAARWSIGNDSGFQ